MGSDSTPVPVWCWPGDGLRDGVLLVEVEMSWRCRCRTAVREWLPAARRAGRDGAAAVAQRRRPNGGRAILEGQAAGGRRRAA